MVKFEDIAKANESIKTTDIKGKEYAEVNQRIKAFRMVHPNGTISSEIVSIENGVVLMKTTIQDDDGKVIGTGYAYEKENSTFINKTSYIENCETSAVGRALGMCGFGIDTSVASYEEVSNAIANQNDGKETKQKKEDHANKNNYRQVLINYCNANGWNMNDIAKQYKLNAKSTEDDFYYALIDLGVEIK